MDIKDKLILSRPLYLTDRDCGYCHQQKERSQAFSLKSWEAKESTVYPHSTTMGFQLENITVQQYDKCIQLGYRRSGKFLYKPDLLRSCCRMYTVRTCWDQFTPHKEHRRDVNKFNSHLGIKAHSKGAYDMENELGRAESEGKLRVEFEKSEFTKEKYDVYVKYQKEIHHDKKCTRSGFTRFLCDSPFPTHGEVKDQTVVQFGAIHQCYYLDDKLIAVGFLDLLPSGVSSVYFVYDPEYKHLALGKVSGLMEMHMTKELGLKWYYLGYYIEDCPKMSYKRKFGAEILNPLDGDFYKYDMLKDSMENGKLFAWDAERERDVSEEQFGVNGRAFTDAEECAERLRINDGIDYLTSRWGALESQDDDSDDDSDMFDVPAVVPGCLSLTEVADEGSTRLKQAELLVFQRTGPLKVAYPLLTPRFQRTVIDLVRMLGWELLKETVVYV